MARIFISGSSDGLGLLAAQQLIKNGHRVTVHGRNEQRAKDAFDACPGAEGTLAGDLTSMAQTRMLAAAANQTGTFDCVIHNAGIYHGGFRRTDEGLPSLIAVNVIAPYILTCQMHKPKRLVFLSSDSHYSGDVSKIDDLVYKERGERGWSDSRGYSDSKLFNNLLANAFAKRWSNTISNSLHPGWMPTKMGGTYAPGDFKKSMETYVMLAEGTDGGAQSAKYFDPGRREGRANPAAADEKAQEQLMRVCAEITGITAPS